MSFEGRSGPSPEFPVQPQTLDNPLSLLSAPDAAQPMLQEYAGFNLRLGRGRGGCQPDTGRVQDRNRNGQMSPEAYNRDINTLFEATNQNAEQAMLQAAQEGKPVVMMFGSRNSRETQNMLQQMARSENVNYRGWMKLIYVDVDTVNPNSNLGRVVSQSFRGGTSAYRLPTTFLFTQHPDGNGNPVPDKPIVIAGAHDPRSYSRMLANYIPRLQQIQQGYNFRPQGPADNQPVPPVIPQPMPVGPVRPPDVRPPDVRPPAPEVRPPGSDVRPPVPEVRPPAAASGVSVYDQHKEIFSDLQKAAKATDPQERDRLYKAAIEAADKVTPQAVMQEVARLQQKFQEVAAGGGSAQDARAIIQQVLSMRDLTQASGIARANMGLSKIKEGNPAEGMSYILEAGRRNPGMYFDPSFARALVRAGYPIEASTALIQAGRANPNFYLQTDGQNYRPATPQPGYSPGMYNPQPGGYNPGTFNPGYAQPGGYNPGRFSPGITQPGGYNPGAFNPGYSQPGGYNPGTFNPGFTQPMGYDPSMFNPGYGQPGGYNPGMFNPGYPTLPQRPVNPLSTINRTRVIR